MTIRNTVDARALHERKEALGEEDSAALTEILDDAFVAAKATAEKHGLTLPTDDRWAEVDAVLFGAIASANPTRFEA